MPVNTNNIVQQRLYLVQVEGPHTRGGRVRYSLGRNGDLVYSVSLQDCLHITTAEIPVELGYTVQRLVEKTNVYGGKPFKMFTTLRQTAFILEA